MQKAELVSAEVQRPDSRWRAHNKKHKMTELSAHSAFKASVWMHFGFYEVEGKKDLDKSHTTCKLCRTKQKYFGNMTNMRNHMHVSSRRRKKNSQL